MDNQDEIELGQYARILKRSWPLLVAFALLFAALAWLFLPEPRSFYESRVSVLLAIGEQDAGRTSDPISEETEVGIALSPLIGTEVISEVGGDLTLEGWRKNLQVSPCLDGDSISSQLDCDNRILHFGYQAATADRAEQLVLATAEKYLETRGDAERSIWDGQREELELQIDDLDLRIDNEIAVRLGLEEDSAEARLSDIRLSRLENQRIDVRSDLNAIGATPISVGRLLGAPSTPVAMSEGVPRLMAVAAGLLMGALFGLLAATFVSRLDRRLSDIDDVELDLGVPVLGDIPKIGEDEPALITATNPTAPGSEAFRRLAAAAMAPRNGRVADSIAVTSAGDGDGRSTAAVNMAIALAQSGRKVMLIAGDRRNQTVDHMFGLTNHPGLNDYLRTTADLEAARAVVVQSEERLGIRVLPTGTGAQQPLSSNGLSSLLAACHERNMVAVFDTPPALTHADGIQICSIVDAVYVVVVQGRTRRSDLDALKTQLLNVQADLAAGILNRVSLLGLAPKKKSDPPAPATFAAPMPPTNEPLPTRPLHGQAEFSESSRGTFGTN